MKMTQQMLPPASGANKITVNGRTYSATPGSVIAVPDFDGDVLEANGWTKVAAGGVGTTSQRPTNPSKGQPFHDSTLGKNIVWDGKTWRDPDSGWGV